MVGDGHQDAMLELSCFLGHLDEHLGEALAIPAVLDLSIGLLGEAEAARTPPELGLWLPMPVVGFTLFDLGLSASDPCCTRGCSVELGEPVPER